VPFQIVNARKHPLNDEEIRMLAEIQTHPKVMEWDVDVHTEDPNEMYLLFKEFFEKLPVDGNQLFLVGKLDEKVIGFLGIHRQSKRLNHVGVVGITVHPDYWRKGYGTQLLKAGVEHAKKKVSLGLKQIRLLRTRQCGESQRRLDSNLKA
jgi:putative acetyltransferase